MQICVVLLLISIFQCWGSNAAKLALFWCKSTHCHYCIVWIRVGQQPLYIRRNWCNIQTEPFLQQLYFSEVCFPRPLATSKLSDQIIPHANTVSRFIIKPKDSMAHIYLHTAFMNGNAGAIVKAHLLHVNTLKFMY